MKFLHAFNLTPGIGYDALRKIWNRFKDWQIAWEFAEMHEFLECGLSEKMAMQIDEARKILNVDYEYARLYEQDIVLVTRESKEYPELLRTIAGAPFAIYRKGAPLINKLPHIAIVGTRVPTAYGEKVAGEIAEAISLAGGIVVSGLAFGIDAMAHYGAVKNNRPTVAVLASGINKITPSSHFRFAEKILSTGGTIISEYAADSDSYKMRYLERNRIISGLCKATIIIEAKEKSGALITADHALKQGREVYALVGDIYRANSKGCHNLIHNGGAYAITSVEGVLSDLNFEYSKAVQASLNENEMCIVCKLQEEPLSTEELAELFLIEIPRMNVMLTQLELKNMIRKNPAFKWEAV